MLRYIVLLLLMTLFAPPLAHAQVPPADLPDEGMAREADGSAGSTEKEQQPESSAPEPPTPPPPPPFPPVPAPPAASPPPAVAGAVATEDELAIATRPPQSGAKAQGVVREDLETSIRLFERGPFSLFIGAMIQVQGAFYVGDQAARTNYDPADTEGFRIRRARFGFSGYLVPHVRFYLAADLKDAVAPSAGSDQGAEILDAKLTYDRVPYARLTAGVDKVPYSAFALQSSARLELIERPIMTSVISPDRRVGITVDGDVGNLEYAAGVYNGSAGVTSGNRLAGVAAAAFARYHIFGRTGRFVPDRLELALGGAYMYDSGEAVSFHRASGHIEVAALRARLLGELLWEDASPKDEPAGLPQAGQVRRWGAAGDLSVFLFRDIVQVAARYEHFRDNDALPTFGKEQLITGGLNFYFYRHNLKLQLNYIRRDQLEGPEVPNDVGFAQLQGTF